MVNQWRIYSFDPELAEFRKPSDFFPHLYGGIRVRLRFFTAFPLSVRRPYTIHDSLPIRADTIGGFIMWEGDRRDLPKSPAERRVMAATVLEKFNLENP